MKEQKSPWQNRIVGEGEKPAGEFKLNELNWRKHPAAQTKALNAILHEVGWVQRVIENRTTGNLIDGHARIEEALKAGKDTPVPYVLVDLAEAEEKKILATFDSIAAMATADADLLETLLTGIENAGDDLSEFLRGLANDNGVLPDFEPASIDEQGKLDELNMIMCPKCSYEFAR